MTRRWMSLTSVALALVVALALLVGCSAGTDQPLKAGAPGETTGPSGVIGGKITVASNMAYPPFEFSPQDGPKGFDIDLMNEIADRAGFKVHYRNVQFDGILRGLDSNLFDAGISGMTITPGREQQLDFSDPYFNADQALLVANNSDVGSLDDLSDAPVGVQFGSTGQIKAEDLANGGQVGGVKPYRTIEGAFAALKSGQVKGVIYDLAISHREIEDSGGTLKVVEPISTGEQYGIAFPQDSPLVEPVNTALAEIKADGTYEKIYKRWMGMPPEEIP